MLEEDAIWLSKKHPKTEIMFGIEGLKAASVESYDMLLNSLVGIAGLLPTYMAIEKGNNIALANKETLVAGGEIITRMAKENETKLLPVDSEHSAIFQCLQGNEGNDIKSITLTASGGPFRGYTEKQLAEVSLEDALKHPNWIMGRKITIDSATMMNKGLEVIEAHWLFGIEGEKINIAVHPQSIIHSMVEFSDNSFIAQMGLPDMKLPISYAFSYPKRLESKDKGLNIFKEGKSLTFERVNQKVFRCVGLAYEALKIGGSYPVVLNGANEALVDLFLNRKIKFIQIQENLEKILNKHKNTNNLSIEEILEIDNEARETAYLMAGYKRGE